jgi:hypothetical protein
MLLLQGAEESLRIQVLGCHAEVSSHSSLHRSTHARDGSRTNECCTLMDGLGYRLSRVYLWYVGDIYVLCYVRWFYLKVAVNICNISKETCFEAGLL